VYCSPQPTFQEAPLRSIDRLPGPRQGLHDLSRLPDEAQRKLDFPRIIPGPPEAMPASGCTVLKILPKLDDAASFCGVAKFA
jgi:hypothetical protein